jgi:Trm5-related predicted tRNA methylase
MTIDVFWLDDSRQIELVKIKFSEYQKISHHVEELRKKTGVFIDPYGDTRLSPEHAHILRNLILGDQSLNKSMNSNLLEVLREAKLENRWLFFSGD